MSDSDEYTLDELNEFINDTLYDKREPPQHVREAAAKALGDLIQGKDVLKRIGLTRKRGQRGKSTIDPDRVPLRSPLFEILRQLAAKEIRYKDAVGMFMKEGNLSERTARRRVEEMRAWGEALCHPLPLNPELVLSHARFQNAIRALSQSVAVFTAKR